MTTTDIGTIVGGIVTAVAGGIVLVINALAALRREAREVAADQNKKLDHIKELTNSNLDAVKERLAATLDQLRVALEVNHRLEALLAQALLANKAAASAVEKS